MYYKKSSKNISADIGAMLNSDNAADTLAAADIVMSAQSLPVGGLPPYGQRPMPGESKFDYALMQAMYPKTAKFILPNVKKAVKSNLGIGSPALRPSGPDRAFVNKVTNDVMDALCRENDEAEEICLGGPCGMWGTKQLLYDLVSVMVLNEIFFDCRRNRKTQK